MSEEGASRLDGITGKMATASARMGSDRERGEGTPLARDQGSEKLSGSEARLKRGNGSGMRNLFTQQL